MKLIKYFISFLTVFIPSFLLLITANNYLKANYISISLFFSFCMSIINLSVFSTLYFTKKDKFFLNLFEFIFFVILTLIIMYFTFSIFIISVFAFLMTI